MLKIHLKQNIDFYLTNEKVQTWSILMTLAFIEYSIEILKKGKTFKNKNQIKNAKY